MEHLLKFFFSNKEFLYLKKFIEKEEEKIIIPIFWWEEREVFWFLIELVLELLLWSLS